MSKLSSRGRTARKYLSEVIKTDKKALTVKVQSPVLPIPQEPSVEIILFQAIVSEKALDFIFQKGTELGLKKIVLFNSANASAKLSLDKFEAKKDRWNKILIEAAKAKRAG